MSEISPLKRQVNLDFYQQMHCCWCCYSLYFVVPLVFVAIFMFMLIVIHMVP
jgi:hypothetical protein